MGKCLPYDESRKCPRCKRKGAWVQFPFPWPGVEGDVREYECVWCHHRWEAPREGQASPVAGQGGERQ